MPEGEFVTVTLGVMCVLVGLLVGWLLADALGQRRLGTARSNWFAREDFLRKIADSERDLLLGRLDKAAADAATERRELYSRIQAYDPNVGDYTPPSITVPPSRPGEEQQEPRSFSEEELGQMALVQQADGMIRDTRNDALFEDVEGWRYWQADLKKRNLPANVHFEVVREYGWERAVQLAKQQTAEKKLAAKN